jgi:putative aldouronate transport system permease protein
MVSKRTNGEKIFSVFNTAFMVFLVIITLYPMLYVVFASFSDPYLLAAHRGPLLKPLGFTLGGYTLVLANPNIPAGYLNTLFYVVAGTSISMVMTTIFAFVLSRRNLYWKAPIMVMVVFTMYFSGGMIPSYILIQRLGLLNTRWALLLPGAITTWNLIVMRTSFMGIPASLEESAYIDGANDITVLLHIIIPLSIPTIAVMVLFYAVGSWNSWFAASIYLRNRNLFPLQLIIREILIINNTNDMLREIENIDRGNFQDLVKYSVIVIATVPILTVYPFLQKYFVKGIMIGALKG